MQKKTFLVLFVATGFYLNLLPVDGERLGNVQQSVDLNWDNKWTYLNWVSWNENNHNAE